MKTSTTYKRKNNTPQELKKTCWNYWDDYNFFTPKKLNKEKGGGVGGRDIIHFQK